jgi:hypothetical protein
MGGGLAKNSESVASFAGWLPASALKVVVYVTLHGRSGGLDAAPLA